MHALILCLLSSSVLAAEINEYYYSTTEQASDTDFKIHGSRNLENIYNLDLTASPHKKFDLSFQELRKNDPTHLEQHEKKFGQYFYGTLDDISTVSPLTMLNYGNNIEGTTQPEKLYLSTSQDSTGSNVELNEPITSTNDQTSTAIPLLEDFTTTVPEKSTKISNEEITHIDVEQEAPESNIMQNYDEQTQFLDLEHSTYTQSTPTVTDESRAKFTLPEWILSNETQKPTNRANRNLGWVNTIKTNVPIEESTTQSAQPSFFSTFPPAPTLSPWFDGFGK